MKTELVWMTRTAELLVIWIIIMILCVRISLNIFWHRREIMKVGTDFVDKMLQRVPAVGRANATRTYHIGLAIGLLFRLGPHIFISSSDWNISPIASSSRNMTAIGRESLLMWTGGWHLRCCGSSRKGLYSTPKLTCSLSSKFVWFVKGLLWYPLGVTAFVAKSSFSPGYSRARL